MHGAAGSRAAANLQNVRAPRAYWASSWYRLKRIHVWFRRRRSCMWHSCHRVYSDVIHASNRTAAPPPHVRYETLSGRPSTPAPMTDVTVWKPVLLQPPWRSSFTAERDSRLVAWGRAASVVPGCVLNNSHPQGRDERPQMLQDGGQCKQQKPNACSARGPSIWNPGGRSSKGSPASTPPPQFCCTLFGMWASPLTWLPFG